MPKDRRDAILEDAAKLAEEVYGNDPSLTESEAFEAEGPHANDETPPAG